MSDLDRSFDHLSLGGAAHQRSSTGSLGPNAASAYDAGDSGANAYGAAPLSSASPFGSGSYAGMGSAQLADPQSASARFERFFASPPASTPDYASGSGAAASSNGLGSGSSAFGSFGHALPGGTSGSGHFGSQSRRPPGRAALPQWGDAPSPPIASQNLGSGYYAPPPPQPQQQPHPPTGSGFMNHQLPPQGMPLPPPGQQGGALDDDIIPTAIVVKNIPFSIKKEQLLQIIEDLAIPMPYAFNYHFDGGNFRGLAFANFRSGEEADAVVAALNGFDVAGRKLRVEYKKVLQAGEKERIEKEKAIKRMHSMQLEKERSRHEQQQHWGALPPNPPLPHEHQPQHQQGPYDQYDQYGYGAPQQQQQQHQLPSPSLEIHPSSQLPPQQQAPRSPLLPLTADSLRAVPAARQGVGAGDAPSEVSGGASSRAKDELDLNDPATLEIYSRVLLFKDDRMRDDLSFSRNLSPLERRTVHLVAQKLGLYHYSMGEGDERYVVVTKNEIQQGHRPLRSQASTIGRSHRGNTNTDSSGMLAPGSSATTGRAGLRGKKSAPDMKRAREADSSYSSHSYGNGGLAPPAGGLTRKSNGNLREGYAATMGRSPRGQNGGAAGLQNLFAGAFDVPPVPQINAERLGHSSSPSGGASAHLLRQPRGPPTPGSHEARNFAPRARVTVGAATGAQIAAQVNRMEHSSSPSGQQGGYDDYLHGGHSLGPDDVRTHEPLEI